MRLAISSIVFVAAFALVGCEKKVETPAVADAGAPEKPACCETVDAGAEAPVAPLTAPTTVVDPAPAAATVAAPTTTVTK